MDLQNAFYLFSLIFLSLGILFLLGCIIFLAFLFFTFRNAKNQLSENVNRVINESKNKAGAAGFGMYIAGKVLSKFKEKR